MILKKVKIYNYRQLQKVELDLQNSLTVLAGPNNSGKTTLISVLKGMFRDKKLSFTYSDIPTNLSTSWVEKIIPVFQSIMVENDKNTGISEIIKKISVDDKLLPEYTIECFHAEIQVDYDPTGDDIQLFADYLMDLDESKHSFYFIYSYEPSIASFEKYLGECYDKMSSRFLDISNPDCKEKETKLYFIKEELLKLYCHASLEKCYFCNSNYENANSIEIIAFKNLFNFRDIPAIRELDDHESDTSKGICLKEPKSKILCITYTNRAADELKKDLDSANVTVSTIHSYINDLISPFYPLKEALDLYWEIFKEKIEARIKNEERDEHIDQSNQHYIEKHGDLNVDLVRENLRELSYGETPFTSLYSGKLSHDDLIMFANKLIKKYPVLLRKISDKYNYIFIDEYQDTSAYILDIFYDAVVNKENIQLYLLGDRMQQIYRNYDGSFEEKLREFDTSQRLVVNHRSIGKIISILNNIYNDDSFKQDPSEKNKDIVPDISPKVIITSNVAEAVEHFQTSFPGILTLYLMNKEKYAEIGAKNLYSTYEKMEAYSFGRKYSPTDVLSDMSNDNPDALMKFLFLLNNIMVLYTKENYGMLISVCRKENKFFNSSLFQLKRHTDKKALRDKFEAVKIVYEREKCLIKDVIECLFEQSLISATVKNIYEESAEYQQVLNIEIAEIKNLANYLRTPYISTQHGVKGESHQSVVFVAADNYSTPNVRMYSFFELWSKNTFSLPEFEDLFYSYSKIIMEVEAKLRMKISDLTAETHNKNEANKKLLAEYSNQVLNTYRDNKLFEALLKDDFIAYLAKSTVGNAKNIFKISKIEGILTAYKLFYVGCSRARKNLVIVVDETKINKFENEFKAKLISIGFEIQGFPMQETATV